MNNLTWIGIVVWGLLIAAFGLFSASPAALEGSSEVQAQDVIFLISGGLVTSMIGAAGLFGFMGNAQALRKEQKNCI